VTEAIVRAARACLETPFVHQGRLPGVGLDCIGLLVAVARAIGYPHQDRDGYGRLPAQGLLESTLSSHLDEVPRSMLQPGDVLAFRFRRDPQHVGILTGDNTLIHAYQQAGKCVEHGYDDEWRRRLVSAWRWREFER
jgi:NlpC/P60 family putative phage cell wall peptidase